MRRYARYSHFLLTSLNASNLGLLIYVIFELKADMGEVLDATTRDRYLVISAVLFCLLTLQARSISPPISPYLPISPHISAVLFCLLTLQASLLPIASDRF